MGLHPISDLDNPAAEAPTVRLLDEEIAEADSVAQARYGTGYQQSRRLQLQTLNDDDLESHVIGARAEAAVCKGLNGSLDALDREASWNGDDGTDIVLRGYSIDVKCTTSGWDSGYEPILKIERRHFENPDHTPDLYFLVEETVPGMYRLIGFVDAEKVEKVGVELDEGDWYRGFESQTENIVVPVEHLTMVKPNWEVSAASPVAAD